MKPLEEIQAILNEFRNNELYQKTDEQIDAEEAAYQRTKDMRYIQEWIATEGVYEQ
jgi:hypothetical protein